MPKFLNIHSLDNCSEDQLKKSKQLPADEFGVTHVDIFYNTELGLCFCLLDAPNRGAVERHHEKLGIKCDWITEVNTTGPSS